MSLSPGEPAYQNLPDTVRVVVWTADKLVRAGLRAKLRSAPGIELIDNVPGADVVLAADSSLPVLLKPTSSLVLVTDEPPMSGLWATAEHGPNVLVPRGEATTDRLLAAIAEAHAACGERTSNSTGHPSGRSRQQPETADRSEPMLSPREADILEMLADGLTTDEIAAALSCSERTVKNLLHTMINRLELRNRSHAVAYCLRRGLI